jgi:DNA-directed RNA polymerase subunit RPC12/RpoP
MSNDVRCPYCGEWQKINHDDGYGYEEDGKFVQECGDCDKIFIYTTQISFGYEAEKAPCQNGDDHKWKAIVSTYHPPGMRRHFCEYCSEKKLFPEQSPEGQEDGK